MNILFAFYAVAFRLFAICHLQFCHFSIFPFGHLLFVPFVAVFMSASISLLLLLLLLALNLQLFAATAVQVQHIFVIINFKLASVNLNRTCHAPKCSPSFDYCIIIFATWRALNTLSKWRLGKSQLKDMNEDRSRLDIEIKNAIYIYSN